MAHGRTVEQERQSRLAANGPQPLITFYDLTTGERVELSHTTVDNWVNKTSGLLLDAAIADGDVIAVELPTHWQRMIWWLAAWKVGACICSSFDDSAELLVCSTSWLDAMPTTVDTVACSLRPMALPADIQLPAHVTDYAIDVRRFPDQLTTPLPDPHTPALRIGSQSWSQSDLISMASPLAPSTRLLMTDACEPREQAQLLASVLASTDSSLVLVTVGGSGELSPDDLASQLERIAQTENVTQRQ